MYSFEGLDGELEPVSKQASHLPKVQSDVIEDVLDVKEVTSRRGNQYKSFLVKWLGKPASESTWIAKEELKKNNPEMYAEVVRVFTPELVSFPTRGE